MPHREPLPEREAHVWYVLPETVTDPAQLEAWTALLSADERARHRRLRVAGGRHLFLVARALVRTVLGRYLGTDPAALELRPDEHGRPELIGAPVPLRFSLSHTDGFVACGVVAGRDVGVDVEPRDRRKRHLALADRYFSAREAAALRAVPEADQRLRFFEYWTLKEAYVKARGLGLALPLDAFTFVLEEGMPVRVEIDARLADDARRWQFALLRPTARHVLAVAVGRGSGSDLPIRLRPLR
jgi:4'-phosphopantetheinyl transferase